jgi:hypothetical protein
MAALNDRLFQELTDALQVLAVLSSHLRRTTSEAGEDAVQIEAAVDRAITVVKELRENGGGNATGK